MFDVVWFNLFVPWLPISSIRSVHWEAVDEHQNRWSSYQNETSNNDNPLRSWGRHASVCDDTHLGFCWRPMDFRRTKALPPRLLVRDPCREREGKQIKWQPSNLGKIGVNDTGSSSHIYDLDFPSKPWDGQKACKYDQNLLQFANSNNRGTAHRSVAAKVAVQAPWIFIDEWTLDSRRTRIGLVDQIK